MDFVNPKLIDTRISYSETKATAIALTFRRPDGSTIVKKGAAFCSPQDKPMLAVGIFEAILDATRDEAFPYTPVAIRSAITEGLLGLRSEDEWTLPEVMAKIKDLSSIYGRLLTGRKDFVAGSCKVIEKGCDEYGPLPRFIEGPPGPSSFLMKETGE